MPPRKNPRHVNVNEAPTPPPPPPPQLDAAMFQAAVTTVVATAILHINTTSVSGYRSVDHHSNHGESLLGRKLKMVFTA